MLQWSMLSQLLLLGYTERMDALPARSRSYCRWPEGTCWAFTRTGHAKGEALA